MTRSSKGEFAQAGSQVESTGLLIVIPTLNEARHIGGHLDWLAPHLDRLDAVVVVADGGSTDGTQEIVRQRSDRRIHLIPNPARLQGAGVNLAVDSFAGPETNWLLRIDAHAAYPEDFCNVLLDEAERMGADSTVVSMVTVGGGFWQTAIALAQNSRLGNGGAAHRGGSKGSWVDHGHHALMRLEAFRKVGGYDPSFSHNEDAELDTRLTAAGYRIWLTGRTWVRYFPRATPTRLALQYLRFGQGRARTVLKHRQRPRARQAVLIALAPLLAFSILVLWHPVFVIPLALWAAACLAGGIAIAISERDWRGLAAGPIAGIMHASWSAGFWREVLTRSFGRRVR